VTQQRDELLGKADLVADILTWNIPAAKQGLSSLDLHFQYYFMLWKGKLSV
jgi:hypothetical protein